MGRAVLIILMGAAALVLVLSLLMPEALRGMDAGSAVLAFGQLVALLVLVGTGFLVRRGHGGEGPESWREGLSYAAIWGGIVLFLIAAYSQRAAFEQLWADMTGAASPASIEVRGDALVIRRAADGHFWARIDVNGVPVRGMIDTGASDLALSRDDAQAAGVDLDGLDYNVPVSTAAGEAWAAGVRLRTVRIGELVFEEPAALVLPEGVDGTLIGQEVLNQFSEVTTRQDEMILTP